MQCNKRRQWTALQTSEPWCIVSDFIAAALLCCKTSQVCTLLNFNASSESKRTADWVRQAWIGLKLGGQAWIGVVANLHHFSFWKVFSWQPEPAYRVFKKGVVFQSLIVNCWKLMDKSGDAEIWHPRHNSNPVGGPKGVEGVSHLDARRNRGQRLTIVCKSNSQAQNGFANICKLILSNFMLRPFVLASSISLLFIPANQRETVTCCDHNNYSLSRRNVIFKISQNSLHRL